MFAFLSVENMYSYPILSYPILSYLILYKFVSIQSCCNCRVSLDAWDLHFAQNENKTNWVSRTIKDAHCIVVIHSEGAYKKCQLMVRIWFEQGCFTNFVVTLYHWSYWLLMSSKVRSNIAPLMRINEDLLSKNSISIEMHYQIAYR